MVIPQQEHQLAHFQLLDYLSLHQLGMDKVAANKLVVDMLDITFGEQIHKQHLA